MQAAVTAWANRDVLWAIWRTLVPPAAFAQLQASWQQVSGWPDWASGASGILP